MAETFREREAEKPPQRVLPAIARETREIHSPLDTLGRVARNMRIPLEQTLSGGARAVARTDFDMRVLRNLSPLRLEGSVPLPSRFMRMLESI
jgi:hypothetical protein